METFSNSRIHVGCVRRLRDDAFLDSKQSAIQFTDQHTHEIWVSPQPGLCENPLEFVFLYHTEQIRFNLTSNLTSPIPKYTQNSGFLPCSVAFLLLCLVNKMPVILCAAAAAACGVLSDTFTDIMTSLVLDTTITISYESEA